jgi:hypothetical protein
MENIVFYSSKTLVSGNNFLIASTYRIQRKNSKTGMVLALYRTIDIVGPWLRAMSQRVVLEDTGWVVPMYCQNGSGLLPYHYSATVDLL